MTEPSEAIHETVGTIQRLLAQGDAAACVEFLSGLHASDVADILEHLDSEEERLRLLEILPAALASDSLAEMDEEEHPEALLARMEPERIAEIVEELADDDATDLIAELEPEQQNRVLDVVRDADAEEIRELLEYPEDSAGGIMTRDLLSVSLGATTGEAIEELRAHATEREEFYTIFVVDAERRMRGVVNIADLVLSSAATPIADLVEEPSAVVPVDMDQEEVGRIMGRYNLPSIGVVDLTGGLVGRITFDDVIDVVEAESTEDILRFAATSEEELVRGTTTDAIRNRLPWLSINFVTLSMAGFIVWLFRETIEQAVILAVAMPVIAGLGGNAGTQALAVTIRRIATTDETVRELWSVVRKEMVVGLINGLAIGLIVAAFGYVLGNGDPRLGLVILVAMWANLVIASTSGAFFPLLLESVGIDPAVASSIFVTTMTDIVGFLLLLGLAKGLLF